MSYRALAGARAAVAAPGAAPPAAPSGAADAAAAALEAPSSFANVGADLALLEDRLYAEAGPLIALWEQVEGLAGSVVAGTPAALELDALRARLTTLTRTSLKIADLGACVAGARTLVGAARAVFDGQPDSSSWLPKLGRVINADVVVGDYEVFKLAMQAFTAKAQGLDEAVLEARRVDLLWLLPEGSFRCPMGAGDVLRAVAATSGVLASPDDDEGIARFLSNLSYFSSAGRTLQTLEAFALPARTQLLELAKEARVQRKILRTEGPSGSAEDQLAARPYRFRDLTLASDSSSAMVLGAAFFIASGAVVSVVASKLPPLATLGIGVALFGVSAVCAVLPARAERQQHWDTAVEAAQRIESLLVEAVNKK